MGIKHSENTGRGLTFVNIDNKVGVLTQHGNALPGASVAGMLVKFMIRPEKFDYNGQTIYKDTLALRIADTDPNEPDISLNVTVASGGNGDNIQGDASYSALRMLAKLNAADLSQPIEIKPWSVKKGQRFGDGVADSDMTGIAVKQNGQSLKDDYGNGVTELPKLLPVMGPKGPVLVQGKEIKDKAPWNELLDSLLEQLASKLPAMREANGQAEGPAADEIDADAVAAAAEASAQPTTPPPADTTAANRTGFRQRA